jgi:uncharacterized repeat protein (TIGR01451 family)
MVARRLALILLVVLARPLVAGTLTCVSSGKSLTLHLEGDRLVIADAHGELAGAPAVSVDHVVIRGASGDRDDQLIVDLSGRLSLPGGIDYDGGADGWDTLVLQGGAVREERITQLNRHDGVVEVDGLMIRYTNLEPITDVAPASTFTISGTAGADVVVFSDGPGGTTTVSSPTFESVTFANKTSVTYDGIAGDDSVVFNNPNPATGLSSLMLTNVANVGQSARLAYPALGINATGNVNLQDASNDLDRLEVTTQNGFIAYEDADDLIIGGVSASLAGVRVIQSGSINVQALGGTLTLDDSDGAEIVKAGALSGDIGLNAAGALSDMIVVPDRAAAVAPAGSIGLQAVHSLLLGTGGPAFANDIRAANDVSMRVLNGLVIGGASTIASDAFGLNNGKGILLFFDGTLAQSGTGRFLAAGTAGGNVELETGTGEMSFLGTGTAVQSTSGNVLLLTRGLVIASTATLTAPLGRFILRGHGLSLGPVVDVPGEPVELSDAELDRIVAPTVELDNTGFVPILQVTAPITFTTGNQLLLRSPDSINGSVTASITAPVLTIELPSFFPLTWNVTPSSFQLGGNTPVAYSGVTTLNLRGQTLAPELAFPADHPDTFFVTPSATTTINVDGYLPAPPTAAGDVLDFDLTGVISPVIAATFTATGYQGSLTSANRQPVNFQAIEQLVDAPVDLTVTKTDGAMAAVAGAPIAYTITVTNPAAIAVTGATVTDTLPAQLTNVTWTCAPSAGSICAPSGSGDINDVVTLAASGSVTYTVNATIDPAAAAGTLTNTANVTTPSGYTETNGANNSATDSDALTTEADLRLTKTTTATAPQPGTTTTYTITLRNAGPSDAQNVTLTDALPAGTTFVSLNAPPGYSCAGTGTITCTRGVLPPSLTPDTFTLIVQIDRSVLPGTTITNTATATSSTTDPSPANSSSAAATLAAVIPTLSQWMLLMLIVLLAGFAVRRH